MGMGMDGLGSAGFSGLVTCLELVSLVESIEE